MNTGAKPEGTHRQVWVALLGLFLLSMLVKLPLFVEPPGRDQGLFLTQAHYLLQGETLYLDIWEHKPPGIILVYAAAIGLFGNDYLSIHLLNWAAALFTACMIFALVSRTTTRVLPATLGAILYLFYHASVPFGGFWSTAQPEVFIEALTAAGVYLALCPIRLRQKRLEIITQPLLLGLLAGVAFLLKYSSLPLLLLAAVFLIKRGEGWKHVATSSFALVSGFVFPVGVLLAYLLAVGALSAFIDATFAFNILHREVASRPITEGLFGKLFYSFDLLLPLYLFGFIALLQFIRRETDRCHHLRLASTLLWLACLLQVFWQAKFWIYHYHVLLLPLVLLAALGVNDVAEWLRVRRGASIARAAVLVAVLLAALPGANWLFRYLNYHHVIPYLADRSEVTALWATYTWGGSDYSYLEQRLVARRLRKELPSGSRLFVFGFEPGTYFFSGLSHASRFLYDYPLMPAFASLHQRFSDALIQDLSQHPPDAFCVLTNDKNDLEKEPSTTQLHERPVLVALLRDEYQSAWQLGDFSCHYRRQIGRKNTVRTTE